MSVWPGMSIDGAAWASIEDAKQAWVDGVLYGKQFVKYDENGRLCRIDPITVEFSDETTAE